MRRSISIAVALFMFMATFATSARAQQPPPPAPYDPAFESPKKTLEVFTEAAGRGDFVHAADALDLRQVRADQRKVQGPEVARQLWAVLDRAVWIDLDAVPDEPRLKGDEKSYRVTMVPLRGRDVPITITATEATTKQLRWSISAATVAITPQLYEQYGPGPLESGLPPSIRDPRLGWLHVWQWLGLVAALPIGFLVGRLIADGLGFFVKRVASRTRATWDDELVERLRGPARLFLGLVAFRMATEPLALSAAALYTLETCVRVAFIGVLGFAAIRVVTVASKSIEDRAIESSTSLTGVMRARGLTTQVHVLRRVINIGIGVLAGALMLTQFETVRNLGVSLLASAGFAGVVLGLAAQRTIGTLIAGIQLSATRLVRIGDDVVVEKEFGVVEEITLTYVVVRIWDERRLIVPMTRFLEHPFENWTRDSASIHGAVYLDVDPGLPVGALRAEVDRILIGHAAWDGRSKSVHVVDAKEHWMRVRVLLSAVNASVLFDLRASVRERLLAWLAAYEDGRFCVRRRIETVEVPHPPAAERRVLDQRQA